MAIPVANPDSYTAQKDTVLVVGTPPSLPLTGNPTALSAAAAGMVPGELKLFESGGANGLTLDLWNATDAAPATSQSYLSNYGPKCSWDSYRGQLHWIGQGHPSGGWGKHIRYIEDTNTWDEASSGQPNHIENTGAGGAIGDYRDVETAKRHSYNNTTVIETNAGTSEVWHRVFNSTAIIRHSESPTDLYESIPFPITASLGIVGFSGMEYWPERHSVILHCGVWGIYEFDILTQQWSNPVDSFNWINGSNATCQYTPINGGCIYMSGGRGDETINGGGGAFTNISNTWLTQTSIGSGLIERLQDSPIAFDNDSNGNGGPSTLTFVDPVSGCLVIFRTNGGITEVWEYDPRRDSAAIGFGSGSDGWHRLNGNDPSGDLRDFEAGLSALDDMSQNCFCSIHNYGVVMIISLDNGGDPIAYLYKHANYS